jgi:uncharacterized iron-regulated membrane protein
VKLTPRTHQIFWDLHAWSGAVGSLLLYVMFFMGAFAPFRPDVDAWAERAPGASHAFVRPKLEPLLEQLERERGAAGIERVAFALEPAGLLAEVRSRDGYLELRYAAERGRLEPVQSGLGSFLFSMHYLGPIPYGIWMAGFSAMALCLALASGLLIHLKDLGRQFFQFRPERPARTWMSDLHKVLGAIGLPYQLLYAWTGAVLCLGYLVVQPVLLRIVYDGDEQRMAEARGEPLEKSAEPRLASAPRRATIDALVEQVEQRTVGLTLTRIRIEPVGDEASVLRLSGDLQGSAFGSVELELRASDGAVSSVRGPEQASVYQRFDAWFRGLHYARFGGYAVPLLYALLAFATCAVIASGNLVWIERRDPARARLGNRLLERLTTGVCAGVIVATAALFLANRLLPDDLAQRAAAEQSVFWATWLGALALPLAWREPRHVAGLELGLAGALLTLVVLLDVLVQPGALDGGAHAGVLASLALLGAASLLAGVRLWRPRDVMGRAGATPASSRASRRMLL